MYGTTWIVGSLILLTLPSLAVAQFSLWLVEQTVKLKHPVANITHQELQGDLKSQDGPLYIVFDTRSHEEYEVSHLPSAIHVDPNMDATTFVKTFGSMTQGKHLVFYCSVGYRSSLFVERVQQQVLSGGAHSLSNLRGGIFRWFNEGRPVINRTGLTETVHPYSDEWGRLVKKRERRAR